MGYRTPVSRGPVVASVAAAGAAGPIFCLTMLLGFFVSQAAERPTWDPTLEAVAGGAVIIVVSIGVGMVIAVLPCLAATALMAAASRVSPIARLASTWLLAGVVASLPILSWFAVDEAAVGFAIAATSALCALVARRVLLR